MVEKKVVSLVADRDMVIDRVLVSVENGVYFVCKPEEYDTAQREGREPVCIGFRKDAILNLDKVGITNEDRQEPIRRSTIADGKGPATENR
jgi:hypothetical protein